jgi:glycerol-1-phosphatase
MPSLMVLTGVSTPRQLLEATADLRPDYVAADLRGLHQPAAQVAIGEQPAWKVRANADSLELSAQPGESTTDALAALRALCAAWWSAASGPVEVQGADGPAWDVLRQLGLV